MKLAIFGLGYVGCVSAACLAELGHEVIGVDVNADKVAQVSAGESPILETGLDALIERAVAGHRMSATTDGAMAARWADASLVCVGTPSRPNGSLETGFVEGVCREIGEALRGGDRPHVLFVRSTLLPGTTEQVVVPALADALGESLESRGLGLVYNPEFLREGSAIADFHEPPYTVVGCADARSEATARELYRGIDAAFHALSLPEAELVKYASNAFHALKVTFANEIGHFSKTAGVDPHKVMDVVVQDTKLNVSPAYLRPGFAFGGSCLPKDLRAVLYSARRNDLELPLLAGILASNAWQVRRAVDLVTSQSSKRVAVLGVTFKAGTDDLRESPIVELVESLIGKGYELSIFDENLAWARLVGANRDFIERTIPHITELLASSAEEAIDRSDLVIVGNGSISAEDVFRASRGKTVIDLVRLAGTGTSQPDAADGDVYHGICW